MLAPKEEKNFDILEKKMPNTTSARGCRGQGAWESFISHRSASQPLLSGVDKGKGEDELGENSVLPQIPVYCAT